MRDVRKTDACWEFSGPIASNGYGRVSWRGQRLYAHRVSYATFVGPLVDTLTIDHLCRNTVCVNPAHLEQVTKPENSRRATRDICPRGHSLIGDNIAYSNGNRPRRHCRLCMNRRGRETYARKVANNANNI